MGYEEIASMIMILHSNQDARGNLQVTKIRGIRSIVIRLRRQELGPPDT